LIVPAKMNFPKSFRLYHLVITIAVAIILGSTLLLKAPSGGKGNRNDSASLRNPGSTSGVFALSPDQIKENYAGATLSDSEIAAILGKSQIGNFRPEQTAALGSTLVGFSLLKDRIPEEFASSVIPSISELLAMLARDRDVDDYLENAAEKGPAGAYYQNVVDLVDTMKPLRANYEALFSGLFDGLASMGRFKVPEQTYVDSKLYKSGVTLPRLSSKPRVREYGLSHTFALDIFYRKIDKVPFSTLEKGPVVFSLADGIVVAATSSWRGGEDLSTYRSGGITPKAGNGVIIYSPARQKYYLYFHLYDVFVSPGDVLHKGYPLGHGGNTGTNARKPGHGEHLHLEIYDARDGRFLRNREIADIVF